MLTALLLKVLEGLHEDEQDFARKLLTRIGRNVERFLALAEELPQVRL